MKTNYMKAALALMTAPLVISFLSGMFDWYMDDGLLIFFGFCMILGTIWAWIIELKN